MHRLFGLLVVVAVTASVAAELLDGRDSSYSTQALLLRLRRLEQENSVLSQEIVGLSRQLPNCTAFVQTGGCDPDGAEELRMGCAELVDAGVSGFCECKGGLRAAKVGCGHATFMCEDECQQHLHGAATGTVRAAVSGASGAAVTLSSPQPTPPVVCGDLRGCRACARVDSCAWCLQTRRCVSDEPWICQGQVRPPRAFTKGGGDHLHSSV